MKDNSILAERVMTSGRRVGFHHYVRKVKSHVFEGGVSNGRGSEEESCERC